MGPSNRLRIGLLAALFAWGCGQPEATLPSETPPPPGEPAFAGPESGFPPEPANVRDLAVVEWQEIPGALTDALEADLRRAAQADPRVAGQLGDRFVYIDAQERFAAKPEEGPAAPTGYRLLFYSYSNNLAVAVSFAGREVESAQTQKGIQPPAGAGEVEAAAQLALADDRLRGMPESLQAYGIILNPREGDEGYGDRILHLTFSGPEDDLPSYFAFVDLTSNKVLRAGPQSALREGQ